MLVLGNVTPQKNGVVGSTTRFSGAHCILKWIDRSTDNRYIHDLLAASFAPGKRKNVLGCPWYLVNGCPNPYKGRLFTSHK